MRTRLLLPSAFVFLVSLLVSPTLGAAESSATAEGPWCSTSPAPCIVSATFDNGEGGGPVTVDASHPVWQLELHQYNDGSETLRLYVTKAGSDELGADSLNDVWVIRIDRGAVIPRVVAGYAKNASVVRGSNVTITGTPVIVTDNDECNPIWPWSCPETAGDERVGYFDVLVTDYAAWDNAAQRAAMNGMNYTTNVGMTSIPPEATYDSTTDSWYLLIRMANHHYRVDGTTLFKGHASLRIPNAFLQLAYGVDDPASMTGVGLAVSGAGGSGTVTVSQESGGDAMLVEIENMTFSRRIVRIKRGVITPTKPRNVQTVRVDATRGRVKFDPAKKRGSKITGYQAACARGSYVVKARNRTSPVVVTGLKPRLPHSCKVRALSKAGPGAWSTSVRMPATP